MKKRIKKKRETLKIICTGNNHAKVYYRGKKIRCTDIDLEFHGHAGEKPMIRCDIEYYKENEYGMPYAVGNEVAKERVHIG